MTCTHASATVQQCRSFFAMEPIAKLSWVLREHCSKCHCRSHLLPVFLSRPKTLPFDVRSRNLSKSMLAHDAVPAAVSHKYHLIIRVGAGLIQIVYGLHSKRDHGAHPSQKSIFTIFFAGFSAHPFELWVFLTCVNMVVKKNMSISLIGSGNSLDPQWLYLKIYISGTKFLRFDGGLLVQNRIPHPSFSSNSHE